MAGICNLCGLPDELCICQEIAKEQQKATISVVRRRYGKMVTIVEGIEDTAIDLGQLAKILKGACASGGTVKGRTIEGRQGARAERLPGGGALDGGFDAHAMVIPHHHGGRFAGPISSRPQRYRIRRDPQDHTRPYRERPRPTREGCHYIHYRLRGGYQRLSRNTTPRGSNQP